MKRPTVVTLCGSRRFVEAWRDEYRRESMAGKIVLTMGCAYGCDGNHADAEKEMLDVLHLRKIDLSDEILVLNIDGYIGQSTANEISYAKRHGKDVRYLESA